MKLKPRQDYRQPLVDAQSCGIEKSSNQVNLQPSDYFVIRDANFGWKADKFVLNKINTRVPASSLMVVIGPVGSGKSTFCKALLGEIHFSQGSVVTKTSPRHVGLCEQTAFSGMVRPERTLSDSHPLTASGMTKSLQPLPSASTSTPYLRETRRISGRMV